MKLFSQKKSEAFPKLGYAVDVYINKIIDIYKLNSNYDNLIYIIKFFKSFFSLSLEEFQNKMKGIKKGEQEFCLLYFLVQGNKSGVKVILNNSNNTINPEYMDDYIQYMKNAATSKLNKAIEKLEELAKQSHPINKAI